MRGEAFAHAAYLAYAQEAERTGELDIAELFRSTAATELDEHFTEEAELIDFVRSNTANLRVSIAGETEEHTTTYPGFAEQARRDGCLPAAALWEELAADEGVHAERFRIALFAITNPGSGVRVPVGVRVPPVPIEATEPVCTGQTQENLLTTLRGEAFAYASYLAYAAHARDTGRLRLARLWENTASQELGEHFAETANLYGLVGSNERNLRTSIAGEQHEATTMYPAFSRQAASVDEGEAAGLFAEIAHDEARHASAFLNALVDLVLGGGAETDEAATAADRQPAPDRPGARA
ncbi:rubrerythrin family protein [Micromonospora endophytica]|uniref:Rubrerythrin family protein n=2 Tax=Micromonospora endophytica TaxID=515350 RepID=A0A2W2CKN2_9ACTN|nr:rubrerythrin family protein [Micromonospora endophytica]RIW46097.1 rubrerythrin family protein [Micromonospora endophytica]